MSSILVLAVLSTIPITRLWVDTPQCNCFLLLVAQASEHEIPKSKQVERRAKKYLPVRKTIIVLTSTNSTTVRQFWGPVSIISGLRRVPPNIPKKCILYERETSTFGSNPHVHSVMTEAHHNRIMSSMKKKALHISPSTRRICQPMGQDTALDN